jgi:hypothetical protein
MPHRTKILCLFCLLINTVAVIRARSEMDAKRTRVVKDESSAFDCH